MADEQFPAPSPAAAIPAGDQVSLDDALQVPLESGPGASSQDSIINAAEIFQQQLEQMTAWKHQLAQQMDLMRRDGIKLLERQKNLAVEKKKLIDERLTLSGERDTIQRLQGETDAESKRLASRAAEIEQAQARLLELQSQREQADRELTARQKTITDQEARHLAEDIRLREGLEQCENERRQLADARRHADQERESLAQKARELDGRAQALDQQQQSVAGREQALQSQKQQLEQALGALGGRENEIQKREAQLQAQAAELQKAQNRLHADQESSQKQRHDLQKKLEAIETEHAEQLETLAKQTKRLSERRAEFEAAEEDLEKALASRIAAATESLKADLARAQGEFQERTRRFEEQLGKTQAAEKSWQSRDAQFQHDLAEGAAQVNRLKEELKAASASLERVSAERSGLAHQLAEQIESAKQEAAKWQQLIHDAHTQNSGNDQSLTQANDHLAAAKNELKAAKEKAAALQTAKDELEFRIELGAEDHHKALEAQKQSLAGEIAQRDAQIQELAQKLEAAEKAGASGVKLTGKESAKVKDLVRQMQMLEGQRNDLASQLFAAQDAHKKLQEEALQTRGNFEAKLLSLEQKSAELEKEKSARQSQKSKAPIPATPETLAQSQKQAAFHRHRLLRQARALRESRMHFTRVESAVTKTRDEVVQQRDQLRARRENLEQVKRLLEKQEMVMARKLADHNAFKTVAAVGIFVIMVLGSAFFGVSHFVHPLYQSEAVVQLAAPSDLQGADLETWLNAQVQYAHSNDVSNAAWKVLKSAENHYTLQDVREEWLTSLQRNLTLSLDSKAKTLTIHYAGTEPEGVSEACNALARAYLQPDLRQSSDGNKDTGQGAQLTQKATPPLNPIEDNRLMICLGVVAGTLFLSLLFVLIFRHFIARQLKEIDQMADMKDLEDIKSEMPEAVRPAVE